MHGVLEVGLGAGAGCGVDALEQSRAAGEQGDFAGGVGGCDFAGGFDADGAAAGDEDGFDGWEEGVHGFQGGAGEGLVGVQGPEGGGGGGAG